MTGGLGLAIGATNLTAVAVGRAAVTRSPVLTLYPHRPPEVGVPAENPNLTERGLVITDFVDRVGDPVGLVASDGSTHRADTLLVDALRALLYALTRGRPPDEPVGVTYPAHWRTAAVDALRTALASVDEFAGSNPAGLVPDASASLTALQDDPGVPTRGVIALCDFGGTGTSITLADAANGFAPVGPTVRHPDLSGDLIDQALLTHVINDLSAAGAVDLSSTSAIGSLTRLRAQCRGAKERLSTATVTSLVVEVPGHRSDVRLTRNELDEAIREPLADFTGELQETVGRSGIRPSDLVAVASVGGGARIPIITTALSEQFRVPVITNAQPELTAAIGGGLKAARGTVEDAVTSMAGAAPAAAAAAAMAANPDPTEMGSEQSALAWSDAEDIPDVAPSQPYEYAGLAAEDAGGGPSAPARPALQFGEREPDEEPPAAVPWYRRPAAKVAAAALVLVALAAAVMFSLQDDDGTPSPASTTPPTATTVAPAPPTTTVAPPPTAETPAPPLSPGETRTVTRQAPPPAPPAPPATQRPPPTTEAPPPPTTQPPPPPPPPTTQPPPPIAPPSEIVIPGLPPIPIGPQPP